MGICGPEVRRIQSEVQNRYRSSLDPQEVYCKHEIGECPSHMLQIVFSRVFRCSRCARAIDSTRPPHVNMSRSGRSGAAKIIRIEDWFGSFKPVYLFSLPHFARRQDKKVLRIVLKRCTAHGERAEPVLQSVLVTTEPCRTGIYFRACCPGVLACPVPIRHASSPKSSTNFPSSVTPSSTFHSRLDCVSNVWSIDWR